MIANIVRTMPEFAKKPLAIFIYFVLAASTLLVFRQVRNFDFITFDDTAYVSENPHITTGLKIDNIIWAFTAKQVGNWHPLTGLSLMLDCQLFRAASLPGGPNPGWIHLVNVFFHIINTLLLFAVLKKMTGSLWPSAFVAALFALHPMHIESVAWIAERKDVLSTFFFMLTLLAYCRYTQQQNKTIYFFALLTFAFGLMAKPMLVTLPFVLLLLDYWPLGRFEVVKNKKAAVAQKSFGLLILEKLPFFVLAAVSSVITFFVQRSSGAVADIHNIPLQSRFANAVVSYAEYVGKMFWPTNLAVFYPFPQAGLPPRQITLSILLLAVISILVIRLGRRQKYLPVGWFWFIGILVPVIGIVQVGDQAMADRYTYIPYIGLFIMLAWGLPELLSKLALSAGNGWRYQKIVLGVSMLIVPAALGIYTFRQVSYWKNSITLFSHAINVTKNNYLAHTNLGDDLSRQGKIPLAIEHYRKSLQLQPDSAYVHNNLGFALAIQGNYAQAVTQFNQAIKLKPDLAKAHNNLAKAFVAQNRFDDAFEQFRQALRLKPDSPALMNDIAFLMVTHPELESSDANEATRLANRACELTNYKNTAFLRTLAIAYSSEGKFKEAIERMKDILEIEPNNSDAKNNLAWIFATCSDSNMRNPSEAIRLAQEACDATNYKNTGKLDTLGAAYASAGRFDEAIETMQKALSLVDKNDKYTVGQFQQHLDLYKVSKPYIETQLPDSFNGKKP
jgi:tetratricopeptide (TPR) repeat protein